MNVPKKEEVSLKFNIIKNLFNLIIFEDDCNNFLNEHQEELKKCAQDEPLLLAKSITTQLSSKFAAIKNLMGISRSLYTIFSKFKMSK